MRVNDYVNIKKEAKRAIINKNEANKVYSRK